MRPVARLEERELGGDPRLGEKLIFRPPVDIRRGVRRVGRANGILGVEPPQGKAGLDEFGAKLREHLARLGCVEPGDNLSLLDAVSGADKQLG